jgi:hypothetical protein
MCIEAVTGTSSDILVQPLSDEQFTQIKQMRSAASDEIGSGVENPNPDPEALPPIKRAAAFLAEAIDAFRKMGIQPKGEHNFGILWLFLTDDESRKKYREEVEQGTAFDNGMLSVYDECKGDFRIFLEQFLCPRITQEMINTKTAVNFPGNEDILIRAEQFEDMKALLDSLMKKYGACPVPLLYCHINFRKKPGWILVHNRLLIDVKEFT